MKCATARKRSVRCSHLPQLAVLTGRFNLRQVAGVPIDQCAVALTPPTDPVALSAADPRAGASAHAVAAGGAATALHALTHWSQASAVRGAAMHCDSESAHLRVSVDLTLPPIVLRRRPSVRAGQLFFSALVVPRSGWGESCHFVASAEASIPPPTPTR